MISKSSKPEEINEAWERMGSLKRYKVLVQVGLSKDKFTRTFSLAKVAKINKWCDVLIPVRTFLDSRFDNGTFINATHERRLKQMEGILKNVDEAERRYENS